MAGMQVANVNSLSSAGLAPQKKQPGVENSMENWVRTDNSEFQLVKLEDIQKQRNNIFV